MCLDYDVISVFNFPQYISLDYEIWLQGDPDTGRFNMILFISGFNQIKLFFFKFVVFQ